jgi:hypothetical protein
MATQSPSAILRKLKKPHDTDKDDPSQKTRTDKDGDDKNDEKMPLKGGKRNALIDFIAKNKKNAA